MLIILAVLLSILPLLSITPPGANDRINPLVTSTLVRAIIQSLTIYKLCNFLGLLDCVKRGLINTALRGTETIEYLQRVFAIPRSSPMVRSRISEGIRAAMSLPGTWPTIRRYLVNTIFDSTFVMLGIIIGSAFTSDPNIRLTVVTILTSSVALGISTGVSTYEAENLEQSKRIDDLEKAMLRPLNDTHIGRSARSSMMLISFVIFLAPLLVGLVILTPFILLKDDIVLAAWAGIALAISVLFITGVLMGRSGGRNPWVQGLRMAFIGGVAFVICYYIESIL